MTLSVSHFVLDEFLPQSSLQHCIKSLRFVGMCASTPSWGLDFEWSSATLWFVYFSSILV